MASVRVRYLFAPEDIDSADSDAYYDCTYRFRDLGYNDDELPDIVPLNDLQMEVKMRKAGSGKNCTAFQVSVVGKNRAKLRHCEERFTGHFVRC